MSYCPHCRYEYEEGLTSCPECGQKLLSGQLPEPAFPGPETEPVRLTVVPDASAADIIRAALAEYSIPAIIQRHGPITGELGRVTDGLTEDSAIIMVPANRLQEAIRVMDEITSGPTIWPEGMEPEE